MTGILAEEMMKKECMRSDCEERGLESKERLKVIVRMERMMSN